MPLGYPLLKSFCFPIHFYPLFIIFSWIFFYAIFKIINIWTLYSEDSQQSQQFIEESQIKTITILTKYTPLPDVIAKIIVNDYLIDKHHNRKIWKYMNKQIQLKKGNLMNYIRIYSCIGVTFYCLCFIIIVIEYIEYIQHSNHSTWEYYLIWIQCILYGHPFWKFINCTAALWALNSFDVVDPSKGQPIYGSNREHSETIQYFYIFISSAYILMIFGGIVPSLIVVVPAVIIYCPIVCTVACVAGICTCLFQNWFEENNFQMVLPLFILCVTYMVTVIGSFSMICVYESGIDDGKWTTCLLDGLVSDYCPDYRFDNSWKAWILLITWILL
eukprot:370013_1